MIKTPQRGKTCLQIGKTDTAIYCTNNWCVVCKYFKNVCQNQSEILQTPNIVNSFVHDFLSCHIPLWSVSTLVVYIKIYVNGIHFQSWAKLNTITQMKEMLSADNLEILIYFVCKWLKTIHLHASIVSSSKIVPSRSGI